MKLFTKQTHNVSRHPQDSLMHRISNDPYLDWMILVIGATALALISIVAGYVVYTDTQQQLTASATSDTAGRPVLFDAEAMSRTLKDFNLRAEEQALLMKGYSGVADPSL